MRSFEIFVVPEPFSVRDARPSRRAREVLDVFIHGANVTARVSEQRTTCVLRDLGTAVADLGARSSGKALVRFYDEPWEICVERFGTSAALSVYRAGADPEVGVYDVHVPYADVHAGVRDAVRSAVEADTSGPLAAELRGVLASLQRPAVESSEQEPTPSPASIETDDTAPISFGADFELRCRKDAGLVGVERTDLHALLFCGRLRAEVRGRPVDLGDGRPFLFAERLLALSQRALSHWERGQVLAVRCDAGGPIVGVRVAMDGRAALSFSDARGGISTTFPALAVTDVVEAALAYGRSIVRVVLRHDRSQASNLRLGGLRRQLRDAQVALREAAKEDAVVNADPAPYRAFAESVRPASPDTLASQAGPRVPTGGRLHYQPRWRALVPGIDLRATFLCKDSLIVGGSADTFCLDTATGQVRWRVETPRAISVPTPLGLARLHADGELRVLDFASGETTVHAHLDPRVGGPPAGAVVGSPTLPRLLVVTEGERHLVAVDLASGERRWRFAWGAGDRVRLRRAGKLLYVSSGDATLTALDVTSGALVWRARDRLHLRGAPVIDHDVVFAITGGTSGRTHLHALCAFSGVAKWSAPVPEETRSCTTEGPPLVCGRSVLVAFRERLGVHLAAYDRETGQPKWKTPHVVAPIGTSWLGLGELAVGNTPTGEVVGLCARTGKTLYRHVLGRILEADVPRRLEPVLRSGALYVPHVDVHVLRPSDGAHLATIGPCDTIPDLLRVDESCNVFLAEESGHLVSFAAGPRLQLVK